MSAEPSVQAVIDLLNRKHNIVSKTDFLISMKTILRHLKSVFPSLTPFIIARQARIACAILIERKVISVFEYRQYRNTEREIFKVHTEALLIA